MGQLGNYRPTIDQLQVWARYTLTVSIQPFEQTMRFPSEGDSYRPSGKALVDYNDCYYSETEWVNL